MYQIMSSTLGPVMTNCYTVINDETREAILIDASGRAEDALKNVRESGASPVAVLLTHAHFDHMDAVPGIKSKYADIPVYIGENDESIMGDPSLNLSYAFMGNPISLKPDKTVSDGDVIELIGLRIKCIEVPGHTEGGMCYLMNIPGEDGAKKHVLFDGDTLFFRSVGRSDFPTGNGELLISSIREKLLTLPDDTIVLPGHDMTTTIGQEKNNPWLR